MSIPGLPDQMPLQQTWSNAQLEQFSLLLAAASRGPGTSLPLANPGMLGNVFAGNMGALPPDSKAASQSMSSSSLNSSPQVLLPHTVDFSPSALLSASLNRHTPDGKSAVRYPEPDVKAFVYDPALGYRFDPSTGLHYDANSGLFVNKKMEILLRYNKLSSMYERAGSTADITAPVLVKEFAELMGYDTAQKPAGPTMNVPQSGVTPQPLPPKPEPTMSPDHAAGVWPVEKKGSSSYNEMSQSPKTPLPPGGSSFSPEKEVVGKYSPKLSPGPEKDSKWSQSPARGTPRQRRGSSPRFSTAFRRSSSTDRSTNQKGWKRDRSRSRSRSVTSNIPPGKTRHQRHGSSSRSKDQGNLGGGDVDETLNSIARIHERILQDPDNVFSRFLPSTFSLNQKSQLQVIMVTPLPPRGDREWADLEILFEGILRTNGVPYDTVSVQPLNGNAPCDHIIVRFKKPEDGIRWYLLHQGALELANPDGSKCTSYMYFSKAPWKCGFCKKWNFPLRGFCYECLRLQKMITMKNPVLPIVETKGKGGSTWVGLRQLDFRITSTQDVLESLPPLNYFGINTCEYVTEDNGLPLGLCVFEMNDKASANEFYRFLQKRNYNPIFLSINSRIGLSKNPYLLRGPTNNPGKKQWVKSTNTKNVCRHQEAQTDLTNLKTLGDYILRSYGIDKETPNQKGTQTILIYKLLQ